MNGNNASRSALSPVSLVGSDWPASSKYGGADSKYQSMQSVNSDYNGGGVNGNQNGPGGLGQGGPISLGQVRSMPFPVPPSGPPPSGPPPPHPGHYVIRGENEGLSGAPSPPSSVARSSDGTGLYTDSGYASLKGIVLEEELAMHHATFRRLLAQDLQNDKNPRQKRARDKLLRLSKIQFQELSTDVYDELQRRQGQIQGQRERNSAGSQQGPDKLPAYLLPKDTFHPKRNQARMKLSTLQPPRFRELVKDVFYELERRYPQFSDNPPYPEPPQSPTGSIGSNRGIMPPGRIASPGPRIASPGPNGLRNGPPLPSYPSPQGPGVSGMGPPSSGPGVGGSNQYGRPLPKTFQSNTIIPNKSTMVEEEDDDGGDDDYGFDDRSSNRNTQDTLPERVGPSGSGDGSSSGRRESSGSKVRSRTNSLRSRNGSLSNSVMGGGSNETDKKLISDYQVQVASLQQKIEDLEILMREKEAETIRLKDEEMQRDASTVEERKEWQEMRQELEAKLADAEKLNNSLEDEIAKLKSDNILNERQLQQQLRDQEQQLQEFRQKLDAQEKDFDKELERMREEERKDLSITSHGDNTNADYEDLLRKHEELKAELKEQQEVTEEVRREATEFLEEMKLLSERSAESLEREEKLHTEMSKLKDEVKEWKSRYARTKTQLRSIRAASMGLALQSTSAQLVKDGGFADPNGVIKDVLVLKFQIAVDDLLRTARSIDPALVLDYMKTVIVATRAITHEVDEFMKESEPSENIARLKIRVSATANNLITAAKNHATANGFSPVSLLDAAASHLSASVVELVKVVKVRPSPQGELEELAEEVVDQCSSRHQSQQFSTFSGGSNRPMTPKYQANGVVGNVRVSADSAYSPMSSPRHTRQMSRGTLSGQWGKRDGLSMMSPPPNGFGSHGPAFGIKAAENSVEALRLFVEEQFEGIVESIQALLSSIRSDGDLETLRRQISDIVLVVGRVVASAETSMSQSGNISLRDRGDFIVKKLDECRKKLVIMSEQGTEISGTANKEFKAKLAGVAFDMAREIKELVRTVEDIDNEARGQALDVREVVDVDDLR